MQPGKVYLVGAGPGDVSLLTQKGMRCLQEADAVVYDRLACPSALNLVRSDCELIFAGKQAGHHFRTQPEINQLLITLAMQGKKVVRLKGGDPCVFGRGGEEVQPLLEYGISYEIVSGVSSCYSVPAYAGIPVTHRDLASSFHVITGHKQCDDQLGEGFETLAKLEGTLVFLMSRENLAHIASELILHGKSPDTPAAVIQKGTTAHQKLAAGTLETIAVEADRMQISTPALTVVGEVVSLQPQQNWFRQGALAGKRILATGTPSHTRKLAEKLAAYGAEAVEISLIQCKIPEDNPCQKISWQDFQWIVFTSANGVTFFQEALRRAGTDIRRLLHLHVAAIGSGTAQALERAGIQADCVPKRFDSVSLAEALLSRLNPGDQVLLLRAENATAVLPELLESAGISCMTIPLYRTEPDLRKQELLQMYLPEMDYVVFSSASAVRAFARMRDPAAAIPEGISIGAVTTEAAKMYGIPIARTAREASAEGIAEALLEER